MNSISDSRVLVKPSLLEKGDTVGLVAPSSPIFEPGDIEFTYAELSKLGLKWKTGKHLFDAVGDLAGSDKNRASDLNEFFADKDIKAIIPIRGGNGSARLLPLLDWDVIEANPKIICGYSDITALLIALHQKTGLVTFHGPSGGSFFESPYTHENFIKALMTNGPIGTIGDPKQKEWDPDYPPFRLVISEGKAKGPLTGGCLTLVKQLMGTAYEIDTKGKILFLEDVSEEPHSIDRMITQLDLSGKFDQVAGIIFGECVSCKPGQSKRERMSLNMSVEQIIRDRFTDFHAPVIYGPRLGHSSEKMVLPLGVKASLSAFETDAIISIDEAATA